MTTYVYVSQHGTIPHILGGADSLSPHQNRKKMIGTSEASPRILEEDRQNSLYERRNRKLRKTLEDMGGETPRHSRAHLISSDQNSPGHLQKSRKPHHLSPLRISQLQTSQEVLSSGISSGGSSVGNPLTDGDGPMTVTTSVPGTATGPVPLLKHRVSERYRRKKKPQGFFKQLNKLSKFVCILIGLWKKHKQKVKVFLENNIDLVSVDAVGDLLFDKSDYTADKQARISTETKRILSRLPILRTPSDIRYVEIALRNYQSLAAYPVSIQNLIARKAWYEKYDGRRIIIRQGHVARCFYFILSGKAVVTQMDNDSSMSKTLCYLKMGDSFGELAFINKTERSATVVSEGTVELLVVTDEDYEDIFTSGELTEKYSPFLKGLSYLTGWPLEMLYSNNSKALISYSRRGAVICANTDDSPWIYIVKSGSITVLKKLKVPEEEKNTDKPSVKMRLMKSLTEEDHMTYLSGALQQETRRLSRKDMATRYLRLKMLNMGSHLTHGIPHLDNKLDPIDKVSTVNPPIPQPSVAELSSTRKKYTGWQMGPMVTRTGTSTLPPLDEVGSGISMVASSQGDIMPHHNQVVDRRMSLDLQQIQANDMKIEKPLPDAFVTVQTLIKGDSFGIAELIHGSQPNFSLVSNGAECIMIEKRLYWDQTINNQLLMRKLKDEILPYPADEKMQDDLVIAINWERHKPKVFQKALRMAKKRKTHNRLRAMGMSVHVQR